MDASVTGAWCIPDESTPSTESVLDRIEADGAIVPGIWPLEVTNMLLIAERRGRLSFAETTRLVEFLSELPITIDTDGLARTFYSVPALARTHRLSSYDASYLELAMRRGLPLATLDKDLAKAATAVGVQLIS